MTEDIVTRLREFGFHGYEKENEAADEIERLRRQIKMWQQIADHLAVVVAKHEPMHLALAPYDIARDWMTERHNDE